MSTKLLIPDKKPDMAVANTTADAYEDFLISRQAMLVTEGTLQFYNFTLGKFIQWLAVRHIYTLNQVNSSLVRHYLSELAEAGKKSSYINGHARAIKTFLRFCIEEKLILEEIKFPMPPIIRERLPYLTENQLREVLEKCASVRDKAIIIFFVDTGVRRMEAILLNWGDLDFKDGSVNVKRGKGGKSRTVVMGGKCRRALLAYRRTIEHDDNDPLFQTVDGRRFTRNGLRSFFVRLSKKAGIGVTPHALRRTFATLSLRAGMSPLHLQGLLGHTTLEMTRRYVQMVDDDLLAAHKSHGPIDHFL